MRNHQTEIYSHECKGLSWAAVFGGVLTSLGIGTLLSLLGIALGFIFFKANADTMSTLGVSSLVWFVISGVISMFACGWIAGFGAHTLNLLKGLMHGLVAWSLAMILGVLVVSSGAGMLISGAGQLVSHMVSTANKAVSAAAPALKASINLVTEGQQERLKAMTEQVNELLKEGASKAQEKSGVKSSQDLVEAIVNPQSEARDKIIQAFKEYVGDSDENQKKHLREVMIEQITKNTRLTQEQSTQIVDKWEQSYQELTDKLSKQAEQLKEKVQEKAEQISNKLSKIALATFFIMVLGVLSTLGGAAMAVKLQRRQTTD